VRDPLAQLRLRLTAWYAGTFAVILLVLGVGLFAAIARQIDRELNASVRRAALELIGAARVREMEARQARGAVVDAVDELHIPDRGLYLFDGAGTLIRPDTANDRLRDVAREAVRDSVVEREFDDPREERTIEVYAERFKLADGNWYVAMAVADRVEIEDRYALLIAAFAVAALAALALVIGGGALLARKSTAPVQQAFEQMRRFMADAAHELRTPITILRARADVARQREREPAAYVETLTEIERDAARMGAIVDDLLTLARADAGERGLRAERCFLDDVVLDAVHAAQPLAGRRGVALEVGAFEEAPVLGEPALLRQAALIVLDNALKYTPAGGTVTVTVGVAGGQCALAVRDTGAGIPPEVLPHVFERFYRGAPAEGREPGAGLGLAIARWIAEAHGGTIAVESEPGCGTTVTIRLPAAVSSS
jgi:signal transduction histidine kinase